MKPLQDAEELAAFAQFVKDQDVRSYLEIGSKHGGSLKAVADAMPPGSKIISVDLPKGTREWSVSEGSLNRVIGEIRGDNKYANVFWGDSTDPTIVELAKQMGPYDLVMIDANHTMRYLLQDWTNYAPMAKMVAFHDISWKRAHDWVGSRIDVPQFWEETKKRFRHVEIQLDETKKNNGIGILWT